MNFLTEPDGDLILNSDMDEVEREAAGWFVDELKKLGALQPATEELKANCPLFCVDKPNQPGQKRCIADCNFLFSPPTHPGGKDSTVVCLL